MVPTAINQSTFGADNLSSTVQHLIVDGSVWNPDFTGEYQWWKTQTCIYRYGFIILIFTSHPLQEMTRRMTDAKGGNRGKLLLIRFSYSA